MKKLLANVFSYLRNMNWFWWIRTNPVRAEDVRANRAIGLTPSNELEILAVSSEGNIFTKWWHYFEIYDHVFGALAEHSRENKLPRPLRILEIGVWRGGSLQLWRKYFGGQAIIFGIDIDEAAGNQGVSEAQIRIGSQTDTEFLGLVLEEMGGIDIVIDDGSHLSKDVIATLNFLFPHLSDGGFYIIEDLHTSYWPKYGGGLRRGSSSAEVLKSIIDMLHQPWIGKTSRHKKLTISEKTLGSIQFFDSVAVIKKADAQPPALFFSREP